MQRYKLDSNIYSIWPTLKKDKFGVGLKKVLIWFNFVNR
jgi:hypothetical protein